MSGLETLPPDQRAVLQLILAQGRGYAELARMLKIDISAVRSRAHAGLETLAGSSEAPDDARRAQIADYLLGQQDDGERLVTLADLDESPVACRWAAALRAQLQPLAHEPLPEVPEPVATNGTVAAASLAAPISAPVLAPLPPPAAPAPAPAAPSPVAEQVPVPTAPATTTTAAVSAAPSAPAASPPAQPPAGDAPPAATGPRPSRRGGAILLGAVAALAAAVVLAIVLIGGGDDNPTPTTAVKTPPTQTSASASPATGDILAQVNLLATPAGGQAAGVGLVQRVSGKLGIAIQADKLPANGAQDIYAAWISGPPGSKLLGFVPNQVKANGTFAVSAALPAGAAKYDTILISREAVAQNSPVPTQPGEAILRGALQLP